jgi:hypothetical protein
VQSTTIKLFLVDGSPKGLRTAEISNWTGKAIACPRNQLSQPLSRTECNNPGVYILCGVDAESGESVVYVGEAEEVGKRIRSHKEKDFWNKSVFFVSKDENLTKGHIKYLEGKLIEKALQVAKAKVLNLQSGGAHLPESDSAEMEVFLSNVYQLLPILGIDFFSPLQDESVKSTGMYYCRIKGLTARGKRSANGFTIFKGSQAVAAHRKSATWSKRLRESLVDKGVMEHRNDHYVFSRDCEFGSPSAAAAVVRGGASNGLTSWKTKAGKTLKEAEKAL